MNRKPGPCMMRGARLLLFNLTYASRKILCASGGLKESEHG